MTTKQRYTYGTVLLLEQEQDEAYWQNCCEKICSLHMNTVVVWPPVFYVNRARDYSVQKRFLEIAHDYKLDVVVELTGQVSNLEYLPDSEYCDDYAVVEAEGSIARMQNGLGELNYNHPEVKKHLESFFTDTVNALKDYPALSGWDVWNETHFKSYDKYTFSEFQKWLQNKYCNIEKLNSYWKKSYTEFSQIRHDPITWASIVPDCDWEEFRTDNLASICKEWIGWIKKIDPKHPTIADNVMSNAVWSEFDRGTDDWKVAACADRYGISFYPKTGGRLLPDNTPWLRSLTFAGAAAAGNGSFVISEMQSHYYSEIFTAERVTPEDIINWNIEALSQGCAGCIYWKWAPFKTGFQLGGRGLVLADGTLSKRAEAAEKIGKFAKNNPDLSQLSPYSKAAVLYDRKNNFTVKAINNRVKHIIGDDQPGQARYGLYRNCWELNIPLSIILPQQLDSIKDNYEVLFMPYQVSLSAELCQKIVSFVEAGGTLVANYPFIDIDENGRLYETLPGGPLNQIIGATHIDNLVIDGQEIQQLELSAGAELIKEIDGNPLIFSRRWGKGKILYAATPLWNAAANDENNNADMILDLLLKDYPELCPAQSNAHATLVKGNEADYLVVSNYEKCDCCNVTLSKAYASAEMIFGTSNMKYEENKFTFQGATQEIVKLER